MTTTTNLGLTVYDLASGSTITFQTWRLAVAGNSSNMSILDTFAGETSASIVTIKSSSISHVFASYISTNYFEATTTSITSYVTNMIIDLKLNATITGSTTININALGNVILKKVDASGNIVNLVSGDLKNGHYYLFIYNGTNFVFIGDQVNVSGTANNLVMISSAGSIVDSGVSASTISSHSSNFSNPHNTTASQVGAPVLTLSNIFTVDNKFNEVNIGKGGSSVYNNTSAGSAALAVNETGSQNTAFGYLTLAANTVGYTNTAVGAESLPANISGDYNSAFGAYALEKNTLGNANTAVGDDSLSDNVIGNFNTGIGDASMASLSSGVFNTALGASSGYNLISGSRNIFIGYRAGRHASQAGSVVNSIAIGSDTYTVLDNTMVLGGSSIVGVGVGKNNPAFMLDVNGSVNIPSGATYNINGSPLGGISASKTFYSASASGGAVTTLNTIIILNGLITSWTQT